MVGPLVLLKRRKTIHTVIHWLPFCNANVIGTCLKCFRYDLYRPPPRKPAAPKSPSSTAAVNQSPHRIIVPGRSSSGSSGGGNSASSSNDGGMTVKRTQYVVGNHGHILNAANTQQVRLRIHET